MAQKPLVLGRSSANSLVKDKPINTAQRGSDWGSIGDGSGARVGQPSIDGVLGLVKGVLQDVEGRAARDMEDEVRP